MTSETNTLEEEMKTLRELTVKLLEELKKKEINEEYRKIALRKNSLNYYHRKRTKDIENGVIVKKSRGRPKKGENESENDNIKK
jgi:hypothetical protein